MKPPDLEKMRDRDLLESAEARMARDARTAPAERTAAELLHELQVHQIELEMQNETLRQAQIELEASRDRYVDFYDFAPVGYLTLGGHGMIEEINLTAAKVLGVERGKLLGKRFEHFVAIDERARWHRLFHGDLRRTGAGELTLRRGDGEAFTAWLVCQDEEDGAGGRGMRLTFTDISKHKLAEQALARSEESFLRLAQISPAAILRTDVNGACTYANQRCAEGVGRPVDELLGDGWRRVMHPEDRERVLADWRRDMSARQPKRLEWRVLRPDGTVRWVLSEAAAELDERGKVTGYLSCISDITELRQREQRRGAELAEQRDTLVREVHHRIKNNLQSVAGLLQRELGSFVELHPRLEAAISQVNAIAVVHGLQSIHADEAIRLCDSVSSICKTVSDLSRRPVRFHIEHEQTAFRPVRVENSEAVSIALVLNELILNAVKHSPPDSAPTVSLSANGSSAQLVIRNAARAATDFNIDTGAGLGTGLRLVRSLLPHEGAHLDYAAEGDDFVLTRLRLTAPVVSKQESRHGTSA